MPRSLPTTLFEDAVDVPLWLEADADTPFGERVRRDREIARGLDPGADTPAAEVRGWWRQISADTEVGPGRRLERLRQVVVVLMALFGLLAGTGVALTAFHYDGTYPVNVVRLLALLVALQTVLLMLTLLLIPGRVPGLRPVQDFIAAINPGALAASLYRRFAKPPPDVAGLFGWEPGRSTAAGRFAKWQFIYWSQIAAVAFNLAALVTGAVTIAFTDLAFGWSTTLAADPVLVSRIVEAIALPWQWIVPSAVPDLALIEQSRFFRLEGGAGFDSESSRALTGWWSFTILAIVTYGLLPRLLLLFFAGFRLRAATVALLVEDPRVTALLDRMSEPEVATASFEPDDSRIDDSPPPSAFHGELSGTARAVVWSMSLARDALQAFARERLGLELATVVEAGGSRDLAEDRLAIDAISKGTERTLVVFTPAWEPPLLEFLDFLSALREKVGSTSIVVTPVAEGLREVTSVERDTWARAVARLADPHVYLEAGNAA